MGSLDEPATTGEVYGIGAYILAMVSVVLMIQFSNAENHVLTILSMFCVLSFWFFARVAWNDGYARSAFKKIGGYDD